MFLPILLLSNEDANTVGVVASAGKTLYEFAILLLLRFSRVEFRYDLGSGPGVIRTHKKISLGRWHRIQARRALGDPGGLQRAFVHTTHGQ